MQKKHFDIFFFCKAKSLMATHSYSSAALHFHICLDFVMKAAIPHKENNVSIKSKCVEEFRKSMQFTNKQSAFHC